MLGQNDPGPQHTHCHSFTILPEVFHPQGQSYVTVDAKSAMGTVRCITGFSIEAQGQVKQTKEKTGLG